MKRHLLVTVSGEKSSLHGLRFVQQFFQNHKDVELTLLYTAPRAADWGPGTASAAEAAAGEKGQQALEEAQEFLCSRHFSKEHVHLKLLPRRNTAALDILEEGESGMYDAVVLGRRGLSRLEEMVEDSVSSEALSQKTVAPLWICRWPEKHRQHVLLGLDGSEASYRMADHVGFMLADEPEHHVRMMRVISPGTSSHKDSEEIFERAGEILASNGVLQNRQHILVVERVNVWKAILEEAETGKYAAVAVGRTGVGGGMIKKLFVGATAENLGRKLNGSALWVNS